MKQIQISMTLKKSTKGTHVYEAIGTAIPSLYIKKEDLPADPPKSITVTVGE